jgi:hypothetical protein
MGKNQGEPARSWASISSMKSAMPRSRSEDSGAATPGKGRPAGVNRCHCTEALAQHRRQDLGERNRAGHPLLLLGKERLQPRVGPGAALRLPAGPRRSRGKLGLLDPPRLSRAPLRPQEAYAPANPPHLGPGRLGWA